MEVLLVGKTISVMVLRIFFLAWIPQWLCWSDKWGWIRSENKQDDWVTMKAARYCCPQYTAWQFIISLHHIVTGHKSIFIQENNKSKDIKCLFIEYVCVSENFVCAVFRLDKIYIHTRKCFLCIRSVVDRIVSEECY